MVGFEQLPIQSTGVGNCGVPIRVWKNLLLCFFWSLKNMVILIQERAWDCRQSLRREAHQIRTVRNFTQRLGKEKALDGIG